MRRSVLPAAGALLVLLPQTACGGSGSQSTCAGGPKAPGVRATLVADHAFVASDVNNLQRRFYTAGATCVAVGGPGATTLEVSEQGITGTRAGRLLKPGHLLMATWMKRATAALPSPTAAVTIDPVQVPLADGGACAASTPAVECAPAGYSPVATGVDSDTVSRAAAGPDPTTGEEVIMVTLTDAGTAVLARITVRLAAASVGTPENDLALFLDETMINDANVHEALSSGQFNISGGVIASDKDLASDIALLINTGKVTPYRVTSQSPL